MMWEGQALRRRDEDAVVVDDRGPTRPTASGWHRKARLPLRHHRIAFGRREPTMPIRRVDNNSGANPPVSTNPRRTTAVREELHHLRRLQQLAEQHQQQSGFTGTLHRRQRSTALVKQLGQRGRQCTLFAQFRCRPEASGTQNVITIGTYQPPASAGSQHITTMKSMANGWRRRTTTRPASNSRCIRGDSHGNQDQQRFRLGIARVSVNAGDVLNQVFVECSA